MLGCSCSVKTIYSYYRKKWLERVEQVIMAQNKAKTTITLGDGQRTSLSYLHKFWSGK